MTYKTDLSLFTIKGERKYLNSKERLDFLVSLESLPIERKLFCLILFYTGARISEVSSLAVLQIDFHEKVVILKTLKRRKPNVFRMIPLPDYVMELLREYLIDVKEEKVGLEHRIWSFSTRTASRFIKKAMNDANIIGPQASALGLRHGFAVHAITIVPISLVQRWMGHTTPNTTVIYLQIRGLEEREWAMKLW